MKLHSHYLFFGFAALFLVAGFWVSTPWLLTGFFYSALVGWAWTMVPISFKAPEAKISDFFPVVMLLLFMMVLCGAPKRSISESLFYTASGLVSFRALLFIMKHMRSSRRAIPKLVQAFMVGLLIEMLLNGIRVYSTFRFVSTDVLLITEQLSLRLLMGCILVGWILDQSFSKREKKLGFTFVLGLIGLPLLSGVILMADTQLLASGRKTEA